jgi:hypothetical protein
MMGPHKLKFIYDGYPWPTQAKSNLRWLTFAHRRLVEPYLPRRPTRTHSFTQIWTHPAPSHRARHRPPRPPPTCTLLPLPISPPPAPALTCSASTAACTTPAARAGLVHTGHRCYWPHPDHWSWVLTLVVHATTAASTPAARAARLPPSGSSTSATHAGVLNTGHRYRSSVTTDLLYTDHPPLTSPPTPAGATLPLPQFRPASAPTLATGLLSH